MKLSSAARPDHGEGRAQALHSSTPRQPSDSPGPFPAAPHRSVIVAAKAEKAPVHPEPKPVETQGKVELEAHKGTTVDFFA